MHRCLTVCQPWAWAILAGLKRFENRTWSTPYRGPLLIHAGAGRGWLAAGRLELEGQGIEMPAPLVFGAILGQVQLVNCFDFRRQASEAARRDPFAAGPFCWEMARPRRCTPVAYKGAQGVFGVPERVMAAARWQRQCRVCGCTEEHGCQEESGGPCDWAADNLCTACQELAATTVCRDAQRIDSQCPCGQPMSAVLRAGQPPRFFIHDGGDWREIKECPGCKRAGFLALTAEQIREGVWEGVKKGVRSQEEGDRS